MSLQIDTIHHINCNEIVLKGTPLTDADFTALIEKVDKLVATNETNLILNFEEIKLINSLGIGTLIKIFTKCRNSGGDLYIVNISDKISQVLLLSKLNTVLNIATSLNDAINKFALTNES